MGRLFSKPLFELTYNIITEVHVSPTHTDGYNEPDTPTNLDRDFMYIKELVSYVSGVGPGYVLSDKVFNDYGPGSNQAAKMFNKPLLVVNASDTQSQIDRGKDYIDN